MDNCYLEVCLRHTFAASRQKQEIKEGMETLSERCRHMTANQALISKLLEHE